MIPYIKLFLALRKSCETLVGEIMQWIIGFMMISLLIFLQMTFFFDFLHIFVRNILLSFHTQVDLNRDWLDYNFQFNSYIILLEFKVCFCTMLNWWWYHVQYMWREHDSISSSKAEVVVIGDSYQYIFPFPSQKYEFVWPHTDGKFEFWS